MVSLPLDARERGYRSMPGIRVNEHALLSEDL